MQHGESFMRRPYENGNSQRSPQLRHCEQCLYAGDVAHTNPKAPFLLVDFRYSIGVYGLLDPNTHAMLVDVEEQ